LQRLHGCGKQKKKELSPKETTDVLVNPLVLLTLQASKKIADFSGGRRTSVLTFPAPSSGEDGSTKEGATLQCKL